MFDPAVAPVHQTLLDVLQWRAAIQPDDEVFTFLVDGEMQEESLSYSQLYRRARGIGAQLQGIGEVGERAIILCPAGLDYIAAFYGCICSGWAAVPLYAPNPDHHIQTIRTVVGSAGPRVGITTRAMLPRIEALFSVLPELGRLQWLLADETPSGAEDTWRQPEIGPKSTAYLMYTSGSTAAPKGVAVAHKGLRLVPMETYHHDGRHQYRVVNWMSPQVTTAITMGFVLPPCAGIPSTHMSPEAFLERPARWIETMSRTRASQTSAPNFAYDLASEAFDLEELKRLDLSNWEYAFNGGELVRAETVERFESTFAAAGLSPGTMRSNYGLTEAARIANARFLPHLTIVSFDREELEAGHVAPMEDGSGRRLVGLGTLGPDVEVVIVDSDTREPCGPDGVGEIWTSGPHLAEGYWNDPEATRDAFEAYLRGGTGPYFRTGDVGFFYRGELFIAGRLKDIIIVRGRNIHAADIEMAAGRADPTLKARACAAFAVESGDEEHVVVIHEILHGTDPTALASAIRRSVTSRIGIQPYAVILVPEGAIPRTSGGKIRRAACRDAYAAGRLLVLFTDDQEHYGAERRTSYVAPHDDLERQLVTVWESVLSVRPIGIHDEFVDLGGDSLHSLQVLARMRVHDIHLDVYALRGAGTVASLADTIRAQQSDPGAPRVLAPEEGPVAGPVPLLVMQYGVLGGKEQLPEDMVRWFPITATEPLDPTLLEAAARALIFHHDVLRMRFHFESHGWEAACLAHTPARILFFHDLSGRSEEESMARMREEGARLHRQIDIQRGVMLQIGLFRYGDGQPDRVLFVLPHLVYDAYSLPIVLEDLETAYRQLKDGQSVQLPARTTSIRRWGERLRELAASDAVRDEVAYWLEVLHNSRPAGQPVSDSGFKLPSVIPPDSIDRSGPGGVRRRLMRLSQSQTESLRLAASRHRFHVQDALLWAIARATASRTGNDSVVLDLLGHGREPIAQDIDLSRTVGFFTAIYPFRVDLDGTLGPIAGVIRVHRQLEAVPHHGATFDALRHFCHTEQCAGLRGPNRPIRLNFLGDGFGGFAGVTLFQPDGQREEELPAGSDDDASEVGAPGPATDLLDIGGMVLEGRLGVRIDYHTHFYAAATVQAFLDEIGEHLRELARVAEAETYRLAGAL